MREVAEGTPVGEDGNIIAVGDTDVAAVMATDANDGSDAVLTYTLSGTDAASFSITRASGSAAPPRPSWTTKTKNSYDRITVKATDSDGLSASIDVTITVTNVDEAPKIAGDDVTKDYPEKGRAQVARFTARDPEGRTVYWSLADDADITVDAADVEDADHFMISSSGVLSFNFSPDYETPLGGNAGNSNTYKVVVAASDNALGSETTDKSHQRWLTRRSPSWSPKVEETETVTLSAQQGQVGVALMATYNDLDDEKPPATVLMWKWYLGGAPVPADGVTSSGLTSTYMPVRRRLSAGRGQLHQDRWHCKKQCRRRSESGWRLTLLTSSLVFGEGA